MSSRIDSDIGSDPDIVANADIISIQNDEIVIRKKVLTDLYSKSVVAFERRKDVTLLANLPKYLGEKIPTQLELRRL